MIKLDRICREADVMLIFARSYGLTGFVRISLKVTYYKFMVFFFSFAPFSEACVGLTETAIKRILRLKILEPGVSLFLVCGRNMQ